MRIVANTLIVQAARLVTLFMGVLTVRSVCHECLAAPSVAVCERGTNPIDVQVESNPRLHQGATVRGVLFLLARE
jgi:hypothetical protein